MKAPLISYNEREKIKEKIRKYKEKNRDRDIKNYFFLAAAHTFNQNIERSPFNTPGASALSLMDYEI
jgi:hypothetical protein